MGWPYNTQWYFENGSGDPEIGGETDGGSQLDIAHYTELSRRGFAPFTGAYAMRVILNGAAQTAFLEDTSILMADDETAYVGFALFLSPDFALSGTTPITIFGLDDGGTVQTEVRLVNSGGVLRFEISHEPAADVTATGYDVPIGEWMWVEFQVLQGNTGVSTLFVTREGETTSATVAATSSANSTQPAIDGAKLGLSINAGTSHTGTMLFDAFHMHDPGDLVAARITAPSQPWRETVNVHVARHVFVGPGSLDNLTLNSGDSSTFESEIRVYDTDRAQTDPDRLVAMLHNTASRETVDVAGVPINLQNGCYVEVLFSDSLVTGAVADTTPRCIATVSPRYYGSRSMISKYGLTRPPA